MEAFPISNGMCGINGFTWKDRVLVQGMNEITKHRGPDGTDVFLDEQVSFGHNRLSIIDPDPRSNQPMTSASGRFVITYNGEIYNFKDLRKELSGYSFKTESDTEVILAAWERWGDGCLPKLNGIFAFAIWDKQEKTLYLARDRSGIKPLYYTHTEQGFIFSSEIKAILESGVPRTLDQEALALYMRVGYVPEPYTMFRGIKKLPPATLLTYKNNKYATSIYWQREMSRDRIRNYDEARTLVAKVVRDSVERQLVSDKPLGVYLSGGIDSSAVLASMAATRRNIDTFSIGFDLGEGEEPEKFNADFNLARSTAQFFNTRHHEYRLSSSDVRESFEQVAYHLDEPSANPTAIAQFILAERAKQSVDVVLSGDGGDELFGGYERYRLSLGASLYQRAVPSIVRTALAGIDRFSKLNTPAGIDRFALFLFRKDREVAPLLSDEHLLLGAHAFFNDKYFSTNPWPTFEEQLMEVDRQSWLVDESLLRTDKLAMAHGLEARVPFLDNELIELSGQLPLSYKLTPMETKRVLKDAFRDALPKELFNQPKRGWFSPAAKWLRHPDMYAFAKEVLSPAYYEPTAALFNWRYVEQILDDHKEKRSYHLTQIWLLMAFQVWARKYHVRL